MEESCDDSLLLESLSSIHPLFYICHNDSLRTLNLPMSVVRSFLTSPSHQHFTFPSYSLSSIPLTKTSLSSKLLIKIAH